MMTQSRVSSSESPLIGDASVLNSFRRNSPGREFSYEVLFSGSIEAINQELNAYLDPGTSGEPGQDLSLGLWEAMHYGTLNGGKRIRSVLAIESCLACGGELENILPTACAIELIHAQSLMHDDLPCMDDDDLRRGKPSVHKAFSESTAVLAGDALIAMAFGLISKHTPIGSPVTAEALLDVLSDFSDVTSVRGLVNGQYVDIFYEGKPFSPEILEYIHTYKTGALFRFSMRAGARLAGASSETVEKFTTLGRKLGLAFQIVDDLLDIASTPEALGKTPGKDQVQQKATYPAFYGEEASRKQVGTLMQEAFEILDTLDGMPVQPLETLSRFISERIH